MSYTFRSGPRDPNTGRTSTIIGSDNLIRDPGTGEAAQPDRSGRVTGITGRERAALRGPAPLPEGALTRDQYMQATGRTVTDPFGLTKGGIGRFFESANQRFGGSGLDYSNTIPFSQRQAIIDRAYDKYLNPTDAQGNLRQFRPNELALLTDPATGARFPARAQAVPRDLGPFSVIPGSSLAQALMGPKTELVPMEGSFTEDVMEEATDIQPTRQESTSIPSLPTGARRLISYDADQGSPFSLNKLFGNISRDGVGNFVDKAIEGFKFGLGTIKPTVDPENKTFGLSYKIPIAMQDPKERARDKAAFDQNALQLEAPKKYIRGSVYETGRIPFNEIPVRQKSLYEGFADPMYGIALDDIVGSSPSVNLSDLQDSDALGNPFAGTTGAFVPQRVVIGEDGKVTTIPIGFAQGGMVKPTKP